MVLARYSAKTNSSQSKKLVQKAINQLDTLILEDGSLKDRTTRGNRALWYHHEALGEVLITFEIARYYGISVSQDLQNRIRKSVKIFINGFKDNASMDKWARVGLRSVYRSGEQVFTHDISKLRWANSWFYIFINRNPRDNLSVELLELLSQNYKNANSDGMVGVGLGCIYGSTTKQIDSLF